ncbi:MAG: ABC transporter transmembrane domain-containing protein [Tissierellia bacterium]|nr:ABC transporter transmembrane domain-containing protein [Tissierellia bacterium]
MKDKNLHIKNIIKNNIPLGAISAAFLIISAVLNIIMAFVLGKIINASLALDLEMFKKNLILIIVVILSGSFFELIGQNLKYRFAKNSTIEYKELLTDNLLKFNFKTYNKYNTSYYLNILVEEVQRVEEHFFLQLISILQNFIQAIIGIIALLFINWKFAIATLIMFFIPLIIPGFMGRILGEKNLVLTQKKEQYIVGVKGILEGFELIKTHDL